MILWNISRAQITGCRRLLLAYSLSWGAIIICRELFLCVAARKSLAEVEAMRRQAKGLAQEYDRLLTEHHQLQVKHTRYIICEHANTKPQKYWLYINSTECFLFFHRISRVLQTKRINNHRNTATFIKCCFIWCVSCDTRTRLCLQDACIIFCIFHFPFKFEFLINFTVTAYQAYWSLIGFLHVSLCNVLKITNLFELYHRAYPYCSC